MRARVDSALQWFVIGLMSALVLDVCWQVVSRFVLRDPATFTEELARYLLVWLGLFGGAYAAGQGRHLAVDLFADSPFRRGAWRVAEGVFGLILIVGGLRLVFIQLALGQTSAALGVPLGLVYLAAPISGALFLYYAIVRRGPAKSGTL